jgi:hypothetical protein
VAQQAAFAALSAAGVLELLARFDAVLAGTYPLDLAVTGSDLDVLCYAPDLNAFEAALREAFGDKPDLRWKRQKVRAAVAGVAHFQSQGLPVEVFGEAVPVKRQYAYRHMLVEARLLRLGGEPLRRAVLELKQAGVKTEAAFAQVLGLRGDPYERLWELSWCEDGVLVGLVPPETAAPG